MRCTAAQKRMPLTVVDSDRHWRNGINPFRGDAIAVVGFTVAAVLAPYTLWKILRTPGSL
jgi:hypothetical protein